MDMATKIIADSAFGCAGQRCLAVSFAVTVGTARNTFTELICDAASTRVVGYGLDAGVQMGPVINAASKARVESLIGLGAKEGASLPVDGRGVSIKGYESGSFVRPTILADVPRGSEIAKTEIFGPVLSLMHVDTVDDAIELINSGQYGNQASLFTSSGSAARMWDVWSSEEITMPLRERIRGSKRRSPARRLSLPSTAQLRPVPPFRCNA